MQRRLLLRARCDGACRILRYIEPPTFPAASPALAPVTNLLINIDHIATLRNARRETFPDPVHAAVLCEAAGADGIVFHLREDRRHITDRDVRLLKQVVRTKLDFELSANADVVGVCCEVQPHLATLVPERREEVTTEGGLDAIGSRARLEQVIPRLYDAGVQEVALFIEPEPDQVAASHALGANCVEFHTGAYAAAATDAARRAEAARVGRAAEAAFALGMQVHAGHGLDYHNYGLFRAAVPHLHEVSIGFAVVARAVLVGLDTAVRDMLRLVKP